MPDRGIVKVRVESVLEAQGVVARQKVKVVEDGPEVLGGIVDAVLLADSDGRVHQVRYGNTLEQFISDSDERCVRPTLLT